MRKNGGGERFIGKVVEMERKLGKRQRNLHVYTVNENITGVTGNKN